MSAYVDDYRIEAQVGHITAHWSHLMADSREELLAFGARLGLKPIWLQDKISGVHFDVTDETRDAAIGLGAVPIRCRSEEWKRVVDEARQQFSGERRPRRYPVVPPVPAVDWSAMPAWEVRERQDAVVSRRVIVDEHEWEIWVYPATPGKFGFSWISGPNSGYGFTSQLNVPVTDVPDDWVETSLRDFMSNINPETGYLD